MKKALKQICLWFLTFSLALVIVETNPNVNALPNHQTIACDDCFGLPGNLGHSHDICFEDEIVMDEFQNKSSMFIGSSDLVIALIVDFKNHYGTAIWQPPKSA